MVINHEHPTRGLLQFGVRLAMCLILNIYLIISWTIIWLGFFKFHSGIHDQFLKWLEKFMSNRKQLVALKYLFFGWVFYNWNASRFCLKSVLFLIYGSLSKYTYISVITQLKDKYQPNWLIDLIFGVLTQLSTIFQLYHGDQF